MSNSALVNYTKISPNKTSPRNKSISKITIHHMAGNLTVESCGNVFARSSAQASANYGVGTDGRIGLYVEEKDRSWASSNPANDHQAVTIEVANDGGAPDWHVSDTAIASLIDLCVDICRRNGIKSLNYTGDSSGNLTRHNMFANTTCPGPYLQSKLSYIAAEVNKRLGVSTGSSTTATVTSGTSTAGGIVASVLNLKTAGIKKFQSWLNNNYGSLCGFNLTVDGAYGAKTRTAAIKALQYHFGVTVDGVWGAKSKAACKVLKLGSTGNGVYILQGLLYCRGSVYAGFDGVYGTLTESEVEAWQKANGLTPDKITGKDVLTSLVAA